MSNQAQTIHTTLVFTAGSFIVATVGLVAAGFQCTLSFLEWQQSERNAAEENAINTALRRVCKTNGTRSAILTKECLLQEIKDGVSGAGITVTER